MKNLLFLLLISPIIYGCSKSETEPENPQLSLPVVTTATIAELTENSALSGGEITNDGGATIISRGVVWSTSDNPTISDNKTTDGTGHGSFTSAISGLNSNTTYYVRAYAINSEGTAYGNVIVFSTPEKIIEAKAYEGFVYLFTQKEVDDFGSQNFTEINGDLIIGDQTGLRFSQITDLTPLKSIISIERLFIGNTSNLQSLEGLNNIVEAENIQIRYNTSLIDINALNQLKRVNSGLEIWFNGSLEVLNSFNNLAEAANVTVGNNTSLLQIEGFENLVNSGSINIISNSSLTEVVGFDQLTSIGYNLHIDDNHVLKAINGFNMLETTGYLNPSVKANRGIFINGNKLLKTIAGFEKLQATTQIIISDNVSLEIIDGLNNLVATEFLELHNTNLSTLNCFLNLVSMGTFYFSHNPNIETFGNFQNINDIGKIRIANNALLQNIDAFKDMDHNTITSVIISGNHSLNSLLGLSGINNISGNLEINDSPLIENLIGLEFLDHVGGYFDLNVNPFLANLDALQNLNFVGSNFRILNNQNLKNFCGLQQLFRNGNIEGSVSISDNAFNPSSQDIIDGNCAQ
ncbi:hypothetical protein SB49_00260 [Sediminicola sp. YIK13]|uniref:hypothetical protein n=1 Tax=Sediminicola sp. YIK13 TaxID=1453352 RepID=UPI00071F320A|nr:hypothetical protein [Sediminicola sp. YIK13]ALM06417.1 hypothetical protein SB49_00260 [Sediminicola sp. YIK13]